MHTGGTRKQKRANPAPSSARTLLYRAMRAYVRNRYVEVLKLCDRVLAIEPHDVSAHQLRARILYKQSDYPAIRQTLKLLGRERAAGAGPQFEARYFFMAGKCSQFELDYPEAMAQLDDARKWQSLLFMGRLL